MENLKLKHDPEKPVSAVALFKGQEGSVTSLQLLKDQLLKAHQTNVPALLICVTGRVVFVNKNGLQETLSATDFIRIEPAVKHWVKAEENSQLLLIK